MRFEDWISLVQLILTVAFVGGVIILGIVMLNASSECARLGYPNYKVTWDLEQYCIKRVNQTDVVILLDSLGDKK